MFRRLQLTRDYYHLLLMEYVQDLVEEVRREVNGPLQSENAFDVNDDLIEQLDRAGLRKIYHR